MYKLKYTKEFERDLKKLSAAEQKQTANKLKLLMQNPFYPSLRTKKVQIDIGHHKDILGL